MTNKGMILPPGNSADSLPSGFCVLEITGVVGENAGIEDAVSENQMVTVTYPTGYVRTHQAKDAADLMDRVTGQLRNYYGVKGAINIVKLPAKLAVGEKIELELE